MDARSFQTADGLHDFTRESSNPMSSANRRDGAMAPTMAEVAAVFHLPIDRAAKQLHVGQTWLKHMCREHGVPRWPFRKIQSLQASAERLAESISDIDPSTCTDPAERERYFTVSQQIQQLNEARAAICRGQCPEESTHGAQEAIKAAARRGRANNANRLRMKAAGNFEEKDDSHGQLPDLQKMPSAAALMRLKMDQTQSPLSHQDSFIDGALSDAALSHLQASNNQIRDVETASTADSPRRDALSAGPLLGMKTSQPNTSRTLFSHDIATNYLLDPATPSSMNTMSLGNAFVQFDMLDSLANGSGTVPANASITASPPAANMSVPQRPSQLQLPTHPQLHPMMQQKGRPTESLLKTLQMLQASHQQTVGNLDLDIANLLHSQDTELTRMDQFDNSTPKHTLLQRQVQHQSPVNYSSPTLPNYSLDEPASLEEFLNPIPHSSPAPAAKPVSQQFASPTVSSPNTPNSSGALQTIAPGRWTIGSKGMAMC